MVTRRQLLACGLAVGVAGCTDLDGEQGDPGENPSGSDESETQAGATVIAHPQGSYVPGAGLEPEDVESVESSLQTIAGVDSVQVRTLTDEAETGAVPEGTIEIRGEIDPDTVATALQEAGFDVETAAVRPGVTTVTADRIVGTLNSRIQTLSEERETEDDADGPSIVPAEIQITHEQRNDRRIVRISGPESVLDSIDDAVFTARGEEIEVLAQTPADTEQGYEEQILLERQDMTPGQVQTGEERGTGIPHVPVSLTNDAAEAMQAAMVETGLAQNPNACRYEANSEPPYGWCFLTTLDGETVYGAGIAPSLAQSFRDGSFTELASFRLTTAELDDAERLHTALRFEPLPVSLTIIDREAGG